MKRLIWISFDLGIQGDYENLYSWLDTYEAQECGNNVAGIHYEYETDLISELKQELKNKVILKESDRIYVVYKDNKGIYKGKFIFGLRKPAPWRGFAVKYEEESEDV